MVHVDRAVNYVPFFSTFSNLINLAQKCFFIPCMNKETQILAYSKPPHNLQNKVELLYYLGFEKEGDFLRRQKTIQSLQNLSYEQFITQARSGLSRENTRRLATLISGTEDPQTSLTYTVISPEEARSLQSGSLSLR